MASHRYYYIDALRGIAALGIVIFHYHHFYLVDAFDRASLPPASDLPYAKLIKPLYSSYSAKAVELFWLISGFVFAHVYLARSATAWEFSVARFARLYPLHFATLCYVAVLQMISFNVVGHWQIYGSNDTRHFILHLLMSSNWTTLSRGLSFNGPIWSVSFEIIVYAVFFLSLFAMRRKPLLIAFLLFGASWTFVALNPLELPLLNKGVILCAGYFFLGTLLYLLRPGSSTSRVLLLLGAGIAALIGGIVFGHENLAISGTAVVAVSLAARLDHIFPNTGVRLSALGDISYSVYLVHVPIQMTALLLADMFFDGTREFADSYLTLPIYFSTSIFLAYVVHKKFERPIGAFVKRKLT